MTAQVRSSSILTFNVYVYALLSLIIQLIPYHVAYYFGRQLHLKDLTKSDVIKFKRAGSSEFSKGELTGRAGIVVDINEN